MFVTVKKGVRGYFAVLMDSEEGPINSSFFHYPTIGPAIVDGEQWADVEGVEFILSDSSNEEGDKNS